MFQLLNPIALFAAASVIIPVLIHLWNTRRGKVLKVGSIALLVESSKKPARSFRITNWPLLLLRCLLLLLIALLIAKPSWQEKPSAQNGGWILIPDRELAGAYRTHRQLIDSLLQKGFELHNLNPQQGKILLQDTATYQQSIPDHFNSWSYLKYLDAALPSDFTMYIFSDQLAQNYSGRRPASDLNIHWITLKAQGPADTSIASSYINREGNPVDIKRISSATGNYYEESIAATPSVPDENPIINVGIYPGNNFADAKYLQAAIEAIAEYTGRNIVINKTNAASREQIIFWLQETEPDKRVLEKLATGGTILRYADLASSSAQLPSPANPGLLPLNENYTGQFFKYAATPAKGTAWWTLANGEPLISVESTGEIKTIYFSSHFNPQWTDLVWNENFARLLIPVILPSFKENDTDYRQLSFEQVKPKQNRGKQNGVVHDLDFMNRTDLSFAGWIIVLIIFIAERILSQGQSKQKNA